MVEEKEVCLQVVLTEAEEVLPVIPSPEEQGWGAPAVVRSLF